MHHFFSNEQNKIMIAYYIDLLAKINTSNEFEKIRNGYITWVLKYMLKQDNEWDKNTQFNISVIAENFTSALNRTKQDIDKKEALDLSFILLFRFYSEFQLYQSIDGIDHYSQMKEFARNNIKEFSSIYSDQIKYAIQDMPSSILKNIMSGQDFSTLRDFIKVKNEAANLKKQWDADLKVRESEVDKFKKSLESYKDGFNFVALYEGFKQLGDTKESELTLARRFLFGIGALIPLIMSYGFWHIVNLKDHIQTPYDLIAFIPATALSIVLLYYFRISLRNYNSIRAQKMQIELRKSLCQFIQDYSKYSKEISRENAGLLSKFEEVIFSNIMTSEDKIPSTFDGLEQLATLIKAVKNKSS